MSRGIAHCHLSAHTGFPLPCVRCANPIMDLPRANSMRRMPPPRTSAEDRAARGRNEAAARERRLAVDVDTQRRALAELHRSPEWTARLAAARRTSVRRKREKLRGGA